jgi:hypothetical protein
LRQQGALEMRTRFIGIAEKYEEDYKSGYEIMIDKINEIGLQKAIQFFNEKYPHKMGKQLSLSHYFVSVGEIDALTDNL